MEREGGGGAGVQKELQVYLGAKSFQWLLRSPANKVSQANVEAKFMQHTHTRTRTHKLTDTHTLNTHTHFHMDHQFKFGRESRRRR